MRLTPKQRLFLGNANSRINMADGSVRSGKTVGSNLRFLKFIMGVEENDHRGDGELVIAGVSAQSVYRNVVLPMGQAVGKNLQYRAGEQKITVYGRDVYIFGADNVAAENKIRGLTVGGCLVDEVTLVHQTFFKQLLARMSPAGAKMFGSTNPDNPKHWLKTDFLDKADELNLYRSTFGIEDNAQNLTRDYIDALKAELTGVFYERMVLGRWVASEGLIYDYYSEASAQYNTDGKDLPTPDGYIAGCDYGIQNPTTVELLALNTRPEPGEPRAWTAGEYFYNGREMKQAKSDSELADDIEDFLAPYRGKLLAFYVDPSAASLIVELKQRGVPVKPADNNVAEGIKTVAKMNKTGEYKLNPNKAPELARERYLYKWDAKAAMKQGIDKPIKEDDHCSDAERYVIFTHFGSKRGGMGAGMTLL